MIAFAERVTCVCGRIGSARWFCLLLLLLVHAFSMHAADESDIWGNTQYNTTEGNEFYIAFIKNAGETKDSENLTLYLQAVATKETNVSVTYLSDNTTETFVVGEGEQQTMHVDITKAYADYDNTPGKKPTEQITKCVLRLPDPHLVRPFHR